MLWNGCPAMGALCRDMGTASDVSRVTFRTGAYCHLSGGPHAVTSRRGQPCQLAAARVGCQGLLAVCPPHRLGFSDPAKDPIAKPHQAVKGHQGHSHPLWLMNPILQHAVAGPESRIRARLPALKPGCTAGWSCFCGLPSSGRVRSVKVTGDHERLLPAQVQEEPKPT